jgi:hypothetical protein
MRRREEQEIIGTIYNTEEGSLSWKSCIIQQQQKVTDEFHTYMFVYICIHVCKYIYIYNFAHNKCVYKYAAGWEMGLSMDSD